MAVKELATYIGRTGQVRYGTVTELTFPVQITDVRENWGRTQVLIITPAGSGETWVNLETVRLDDAN